MVFCEQCVPVCGCFGFKLNVLIPRFLCQIGEGILLPMGIDNIDDALQQYCRSASAILSMPIGNNILPFVWEFNLSDFLTLS
ncbi:hypothetical protein M2101_000141 [Parabacteroides sp. PM5-20]|nr:hypothetical protein [Parabacteroides sp. PM5-20]